MDTQKTKLQKEIGQEIKRRRSELHLSLQDVEKLTNIKMGNISNIEQGKINITMQTVEVFMRAYQVKAIFKLIKPRIKK